MTKTNHPIEQEELMAYLDGELATERAVTAAAHLEHCQECQRLAADLKSISQKLMEWEVESSDSESAPEIAAALEERAKEPKKQVVFARRNWRLIFGARQRVWAGGFAVGVLILAVGLITNLRRSPSSPLVGDFADANGRFIAPPPPSRYAPKEGHTTGMLSSPSQGASEDKGQSEVLHMLYDNEGRLIPSPTPHPSDSGGIVGTSDQDEDPAGNTGEGDDLTPSNGPLIVRTAGLTVIVKEFDKARVALDEILKRHHGYMGQLNVFVPAEAGRSITATLRVPANQLDATLAELKALGRVEGESQGGEEVTQQYVDLQARLANAKHMEQRLTDILRQRTGKLSDVLAVEVQIGRVRGEIERMQAEKKELTKQVQFASLNATVKEDYKAPMQMAPPSTSSRFHNAAVDGYRSVVEGFVDVLLFLLSAGPSLLVWAAILFFPARWAWRKLKKNLVKPDVPAVS
jgi:hypothetical protein